MGNFMRRTLAFILGMIFMVVVLVGGIAGGAYWAFKNLTLGTLGVGESDSDLSSWTLEDLTAFVMDVSKDPQSFTLSELEKYGLDIDQMLTDMGVDLTTANYQDVESLKSLALGALFNEKGLSEVNMGVIFLLLPKSPDTGRYPIFSEAARSRLRQFNLGDLIYPDENGSAGAVNVLRSMKLGSILSDNFSETYKDGEYTYACEDRGLNLFADVELGLFTGSLEGKSTDIGYEIMEGYLTCLKTKSLREVLASFGAVDDETYNKNLETFAMLGDVKLQDAFVWNEENGWYELDTEKIFTIGTVGSIIGYSVCTEDDKCPVHSNVEDCDGELYEGNEISSETEPKKTFIKNLAPLSVTELMGLDMDTLFEGMYLGEAFGYKKGYPSNACAEDCAEEHEHTVYDYCRPNCKGAHEKAHNFYFTDEKGYVGDMLNDLSNHTFIDALNGDLDIEGIIDDTTIGEVMGYTNKNGVWVDDNNQPVERTELVDKIFYQLYDKKVSELSSVPFETLVDGILLGEMLGLKKCNLTVNGCPVHEECGESVEYWYNGQERVSVMYNVLADIPITELTKDGGSIIQDELSVLQVGDLMDGYVKDGDDWFKTDEEGNHVPLTAVEDVLANINLGEIFDGKFELKDKINTLSIGDVIEVGDNPILSLVDDCKIEELPTKINGLNVGEIMGYIYSEEDGWLEDTDKDGDGDVAVTGIKLKLSKLTIQELADGGFNTIMDEIILSDVIDDYESGALGIINPEVFVGGEDPDYIDVNENGVPDKGEVKIDKLATVIANSAKIAPYGELEDAGILQFDTTVLEGLDAFYEEEGLSNWREVKTVNQILNDLISDSLS